LQSLMWPRLSSADLRWATIGRACNRIPVSAFFTHFCHTRCSTTGTEPAEIRSLALLIGRQILAVLFTLRGERLDQRSEPFRVRGRGGGSSIAGSER